VSGVCSSFSSRDRPRNDVGWSGLTTGGRPRARRPGPEGGEGRRSRPHVRGPLRPRREGTGSGWHANPRAHTTSESRVACSAVRRRQHDLARPGGAPARHPGQAELGHAHVHLARLDLDGRGLVADALPLLGQLGLLRQVVGRQLALLLLPDFGIEDSTLKNPILAYRLLDRKGRRFYTIKGKTCPADTDAQGERWLIRWPG
jgi:hypothetical protein